MQQAVLILSGGMDSATLLYELRALDIDVYTLSFSYGQKHSKELKYAEMIAGMAGAHHKVVDIGFLKNIAPSALTRDAIKVPDGMYSDDNMKSTVVPYRNMIMLSIAASYAAGLNIGEVYYGAHAGDHHIYPDCRPVFINTLNKAFERGDYSEIKLMAPYQNITKSDICKRGLELGVPYEYTWTCYKGEDVPCGTCGSCTERAEAFADNGVDDPLLTRGETLRMVGMEDENKEDINEE